MFFTEEANPLSVMVLVVIGPCGFRSHSIIDNLRQRFGADFVFQQDNAPPHSSKYTQQHLLNQLPFVLKCPARSPNLSPIK